MEIIRNDSIAFTNDNMFWKPRRCQANAVDCFVEHYYNSGNDRGILRMCCGAGKTFTFYLIMTKVISNGGYVFLYCTTKLALIDQFIDDMCKFHKGDRKLVIVPRCSGGHSSRLGLRGKNGGEVEIRDKWGATRNGDNEVLIVVTTYATLRTVKFRKDVESLMFDLATYDESHVSAGDAKKTTQFCINRSSSDGIVPFSIKKYLFMTATPTQLSGKDGDTKGSMDNRDEYGDIFYNYKFRDGVYEGIVVPFKVVYMNTPRHFARSENIGVDETILRWYFNLANKIGAGLVYGAITKTVIYESCMDKVDKLVETINKCKDAYDRTDVWVAKYYSEMNKSEKKDNLKLFQTPNDRVEGKPALMILCVVQSFNEGIDVPLCDSVLFLYDKKASPSTLVQNIGRALRATKGKKGAYVFIPTVVNDLEDNANGKCYIKLRSILSDLLINEPNYYSPNDNMINGGGERSRELHKCNREVSDVLVDTVVDHEIVTKIWDPLTQTTSRMDDWLRGAINAKYGLLSISNTDRLTHMRDIRTILNTENRNGEPLIDFVPRFIYNGGGIARIVSLQLLRVLSPKSRICPDIPSIGDILWDSTFTYAETYDCLDMLYREWECDGVPEWSVFCNSVVTSVRVFVGALVKCKEDEIVVSGLTFNHGRNVLFRKLADLQYELGDDYKVVKHDLRHNFYQYVKVRTVYSLITDCKIVGLPPKDMWNRLYRNDFQKYGHYLQTVLADFNAKYPSINTTGSQMVPIRTNKLELLNGSVPSILPGVWGPLPLYPKLVDDCKDMLVGYFNCNPNDVVMLPNKNTCKLNPGLTPGVCIHFTRGTGVKTEFFSLSGVITIDRVRQKRTLLGESAFPSVKQAIMDYIEKYTLVKSSK